MIIMNHCNSCCRNSVCSDKIKELKNQDFSNILIIAKCKDLLLPINTAVGMNLEGITVRDTFNHCDDCDFAIKCKYFKHTEMLKEIDRVTTLCVEKGFGNIRYACKMHRPLNPITEQVQETIQKKEKCFKFKLRNKECTKW